MNSRRMMSAAVVTAVALGWAVVATADVSRNVIAAFRGDLVITKSELPDGKSDKDTIAKIKAERVKELVGEAKDDVVHWHFHYTAFLTKTGATQLKMEFYTNDKDKKFVADKRIDGVDPKTPALSGDISIDEDEGLTKGTAYVVKLVGEKNAVVAQTPLVMK